MFKNLKIKTRHARFRDFVVIKIDSDEIASTMKVYSLLYRIGVLLLGFWMFMACSSDNSEVQEPAEDPDSERTETWNVIIEPEYVLIDVDKNAHRVAPAMEAVDKEGKRLATFIKDEVNGIILEEGYRYDLQIEAKLNSNTLGKSAYTYKLKNIVDKSYVGINHTSRREVKMQIAPVKVLPKDEKESWSYERLCGYIEGSDEKVDLLMGEIQGMDYREFYNNSKMNRVRVIASITPSSRPVYEGKNQRIRLISILSKETQQTDSIVYSNSTNTKDTIPSPTNNSQYGDFEMVWSINGSEIGRGILHAELNSTSTFGIYMETENNMTKFFVDSIFKKPFNSFEIHKVTFDVGNATYNSALQYTYVGYTADAFYYNIKDWKYHAIAKLDDTSYMFQPVVDYEKSTMTYDSKTNQWLGAITIKQIDVGQAYIVPTPPWMWNYPMSPPIKIVFNTTKKVK